MVFQNSIEFILQLSILTIIDILFFSWGSPAQNLKIHRYKQTSTIVESEYSLTKYERNLQITEVPSVAYPILLRMIHECTPEGVFVKVHESQKEDQEVRYIPDNQLTNLKSQLQNLGGSSQKKNKK